MSQGGYIVPTSALPVIEAGALAEMRFYMGLLGRPVDPDIETPNDNPDEVTDDGLGLPPQPEVITDADVDEDDPDVQEVPIVEPKEF